MILTLLLMLSHMLMLMIRLRSGLNCIQGRTELCRRMFESLGYKVKKLDSVYFAGLTKKNVRRGKWRFLTEKEVSMLKRGIF